MGGPRGQKHGFTLIELSIVLVIIGLIIGGILVGQDLISQAATRAQIAQLEKYNAAVNTFRNKYGGLPGDLLYTQASQFGFVTTGCTGATGMRDGNGLIDGSSTNVYTQTTNETGLFWQDLSTAKLIDAAIPNGATSVVCNAIRSGSGSQIANYFPAAKVGSGNYLYAFERTGVNWLGILGITQVDGAGSMTSATMPLTVAQAYSIDTKIDDGLPNTGHVVNGQVCNANNYCVFISATDSVTSCAHYFTVSGYNPGYSMGVSNGAGLNCALSFQMQ